MRPLHTLVLLVVLLVAGAGAWLFLGGRSATPEAINAGTKASAPAPASPADSSLRVPGNTAKAPVTTPERVALEATPEPAAATNATASEPRVTGRVIDPFGNPLANALVYVAPGGGFGLPLDHTGLADSRWMKRSETRTAADGTFDIAGPKPGLLRVAVRAPGFAPLDKNDLPLPAAPRHDVGDLVMQQGVVLEGRVVDSLGRGVPETKLWKEDPSVGGGFFLSLGGERSGVLLGETGSAGEFRIDQLEAGPWKLRATNPDHPDRVAEGITERGGQVASGLRIELEDGFTISGRLTGAPSLDDLTVRASPGRGASEGEGFALVFEGDFGGGDSREAEIAADGTFAVRGLRGNKKYNLQARKKRSDYFQSTQSASVAAQPGDRGVELVWQPEAALVFQVVDKTTGDPVTDMTISAGIQWPMPLLDDENRPVREHEGGNVRFGNLRPKSEKDRARLEISAVGYRDYEQKGIVLRPGQETELGIIELEPVSVVRVTVRDRKTGTPIEGARVALREDEGGGQQHGAMFVSRTVTASSEDGDFEIHGDETNRSKTDAAGLATVNAIEGKSQVLSVTHGGYAPYKGQAFVVEDGKNADQEVLLGPGGAVAVKLVTSKGEPVAGGRIEHRAPSGGGGPDFDFMGQQEGAKNVTDSNGLVTFEHLEPGTHRFRSAGGSMGGGFMGDVGFVSFAGPGGEEDENWVDVVVVEDGTAEATVVAPTKVQLTGRVREGGEPLAGATVSLSKRRPGDAGMRMPMFGGGGPEAKTDGQGRYAIDNVESGDYTLRVEHPQRLMPAELEVTVLDADLVRDVELSVAIIEGRIVDQNGDPIAGIRVWPERAQKGGTEQRRAIRIVMESDGDGSSMVMGGDSGMQGLEKRTDANGNYTLRGVLDGVELQVVAEGPGVQQGRSRAVTLAPDQIMRGVDLELKAAGEIQVIAQRPDGAAAGNLLVTATFEGEPEGDRPAPQTSFVAGDGKARLTGLAAGKWSVSLRRLGFGGGGNSGEVEIPAQVIEVTVGATAEAKFVVP